jgi:hypothetical protein
MPRSRSILVLRSISVATTNALARREQALAGHVVDFESSTVGVLKEHRVVPRRKGVLPKAMDDVRANAFQKGVSLVYVAILSRTPAMVMQADRALPETLANSGLAAWMPKPVRPPTP